MGEIVVVRFCDLASSLRWDNFEMAEALGLVEAILLGLMEAYLDLMFLATSALSFSRSLIPAPEFSWWSLSSFQAAIA